MKHRPAFSTLAPRWRPPRDRQRITTIDAHTGGEPLRVIVSGFPEVPGKTMLEKRRYLKEHFDHLRTSLMWEPRGHADMYGCLVVPPVSNDADFGVLFLHNEGYSSMCGHGIIAVTKVAIEVGFVKRVEPETVVRIDTPAGLVTARAAVAKGLVQSVTFLNVPSFVYLQDKSVTVSGIGRVRFDIAFGGAFYAFVKASDVGVKCVPEDFRKLIDMGMKIKRAVMKRFPITHPFEPDLGFLYGTIFIGPAAGAGAHSRNVCVFAEGEVDRSPTGTGVSARLALHFARNEIRVGESIVVESIIGSRFRGCIREVTDYGPYRAVVPEVEGTAHIYGRNELLIDPADLLAKGFMLR